NRDIILTNCKLSSKTRSRLLHSIGTNFALRQVDRIREFELDRVEIMLIDTALESDRKWLTVEKMAQMSQLKFIQSSRAGVDAIDLEQLPKRIIICGNIGAYSDPMAEHTIGMILYLAKDLGNRNSKLKNGVVY